MPVALLNEIVLAVVGFIIGWKLNNKKHKVEETFNKFKESRW